MRKYDALVLLSLILSVIIMTGCVSKNLASEDFDRSAKQFNPPADKSFIYVLRSSYHGDWHMGVTLDGKTVGSIRNKTYVLLEVLPGHHQLKLGPLVTKIDAPDIELETLPGRSYFVSARFEMTGSKLFNMSK